MSLLHHHHHHHHRFQPDEPKPQHSYIGLIAMAILGSPETKLVLSDIYQYILDNYPYFRARGPGWRNSIRHNLSLNDCFVKAGRSANGKGHYWAIHPANVDDFRRGDFRRRKAQRKVRKHMGLAVDDDGNDSPSPPPLTPPPHVLPSNTSLWPPPPPNGSPLIFPANFPVIPAPTTTTTGSSISKKRQFDVASLLEPDDEDRSSGVKKSSTYYYHHHHHDHYRNHSSGSEEADDEAVTTNTDVVTSSRSGSVKSDSNNPSPDKNHDDGEISPTPTGVVESFNSPNKETSLWHYHQPISSSMSGAGPIVVNEASSREVILEHQHHQQLMTRAYYEHLSHARTIQIGLYQQWQLQRQTSVPNENLPPADANRVV